MPKPNLSDILIQELTARQAEDGGHYPVCLNHLTDRLDPVPESAAVLKAVGSKKFTNRAIVAVKGRMDAPVALIGDLSHLAVSPLTLELALRVKGEKGAAPWTSSGLAGAVQKLLKPAFVEALNRQIASDELPAFAIRTGKGKTVKIYHRDKPPPPPPPKPPKPEIQDAERLLDLLRRRERPGITLDELQETAGLKPTAFKKAVKQPAFADAVAQVKVKPNDVYVVPKGDEFGRFVTGTLLLRLLKGCNRTKAHAFPVKELTSLVSGKAQQQVVTGLLSRSDLVNDLPAGVGCILVSAGKGEGQNVFFLLEHLQTARNVIAFGPAQASPADFVAAFDAAFARIDRERGSNNFVSLVDLRSALPNVPREAFDAGLHEMRRDRRYVLNSAEHSNGITPEQKAAAVREEGEFLLHVSRGRQ